MLTSWRLGDSLTSKVETVQSQYDLNRQRIRPVHDIYGSHFESRLVLEARFLELQNSCVGPPTALSLNESSKITGTFLLERSSMVQ